MKNQNAKDLLAILTCAKSCWKAYCEACEKFSNAESEEDVQYYSTRSSEIHAAYRAYIHCYEILTDKSIAGCSQLDGELETVSNEVLLG